MTYLNQNIAAKLMELVLAAFRSETADLERLAEEVDAAGQDVGNIRTAIEQYAKRRTQAMETIHSMLQADAAEFRKGNVLHRDLLLAFPAVTIERIE